MPAISICEPIDALHHALQPNAAKSSDDVSTKLSINTTRILENNVQYKELEETVTLEVKTKCTVLSLPNSEFSEEKLKELANVKRNEKINKGPVLPVPAITLYSPRRVTLGWTGTFPVGAGMYNMGNSCFLNSVLQALFHTPAVVNWLLSDSQHKAKCAKSGTTGDCLICLMEKTLQFSHVKSGCAIKPFNIFNKLKFICRTMVPGQQEDAHEFLRHLLEGMEKAYLTRRNATKLDSFSKETTPINQIFGGYLRSEVKCLQCRHVSITFQHFQDLLVDIRKATTLEDALSSYFNREQLDSNDYKCEGCNKRVPATKQFSLQRPPKVLCIQLKRFSVLGGKITKHISFKQTVNLGPYIWMEPGEPMQNLTYKLNSIVTHTGTSSGSGHYTAVAQASTGQFYIFDDTCVRPISLNNVLNTNAYIMIYELDHQAQAQPGTKINGSININHSADSTEESTSDTSTCELTEPEMAPSNGCIENNETLNQVSPIPEDTNMVHFPPLKSKDFIGPQLPQKLQDKSHPRLIMQIKNGKILNGSSLVPYEASSEEEEPSLKNHVTSNAPPKTISYANILSNTSKPSQVKSSTTKCLNSQEIEKSVPNTNNTITQCGKSQTNNSMTTLCGKNQLNQNSTAVQCGKNQNGSNNNPIGYQNGKSEVNGRTEDPNKWYRTSKGKHGIKHEDPVKTAYIVTKGWQVSKDTFLPSPTATPNGWSVTDKDDVKTVGTSNVAPSAAALRDFNGTNRSETLSRLLKMSHRGYGTSSVVNWSNNKTHLTREVDNDRRDERKRHYNPDDDEIDRGRIKKVKDHRTHEARGNTGYNPFQEYQNNKTWNRSSSDYYRKHYYNTTSYARPRYGRNHRPHNYRYHNHSRVHWQRG